jgi:hypothetical protein
MEKTLPSDFTSTSYHVAFFLEPYFQSFTQKVKHDILLCHYTEMGPTSITDKPQIKLKHKFIADATILSVVVRWMFSPSTGFIDNGSEGKGQIAHVHCEETGWTRCQPWTFFFRIHLTLCIWGQGFKITFTVWLGVRKKIKFQGAAGIEWTAQQSAFGAYAVICISVICNGLGDRTVNSANSLVSPLRQRIAMAFRLSSSTIYDKHLDDRTAQQSSSYFQNETKLMTRDNAVGGYKLEERGVGARVPGGSPRRPERLCSPHSFLREVKISAGTWGWSFTRNYCRDQQSHSLPHVLMA